VSEDNNPYDNTFHGKLHTQDLPKIGIRQVDGRVGDTVELRMQFRDFARLQIGGKWFVISDDFLWRLDAKLKKADEVADNMDYDGDGIKNGVFWIDNGSNYGADNDGF